MRAFVLGCGAMGRAIVRELAESADVTEIVIGDLDPEGAAAYLRDRRIGKTSVQLADARDPRGLARKVAGAQVVANATWYEHNVDVMEAALEARAHYVDLGGLYHVTLKQLQLSDAFRTARLTAILGMGASPGMTNLLAALGMSRLDRVTEIHIRTGTRGGAGFAYSVRTILDELTMRPVVFEDGQLRDVDPLSGREEYDLPEPVGRVTGFYSIHSELATLPRLTPDIRAVTFRVAFSPAMLERLRVLEGLGLLGTGPVRTRLGDLSPREFLDAHLSALPEPATLEEHKALRVSLSGVREGRTARWVGETTVASRPEWGLRATAIWTGVPAALVARLLAHGELRPHGVFAPEQAVPPEAFFSRLAARGISIQERTVPEG